MNLPLWSAIREYIAAEIKLSHLRPHREQVRTAEFFDYRPQTLEALDASIAESEAQSTRMETEVRRLIERLPQPPVMLGPDPDAPLEIEDSHSGDKGEQHG